MVFHIISVSVRQKLVALQNFEILKIGWKINQDEWGIVTFDVAESGRKGTGTFIIFFYPPYAHEFDFVNL